MNINTALPGQTEAELRGGGFDDRRMTTNNTTTSPTGLFVCRFQGCTAPPFSTQYLLKYDS